MNMDQALQTFIIESRELLQDMEAALLRVESAPQDEDTINAIFRAAHTIKGSAGLFGLDGIVAFTHVAESVLDKVRDGNIQIDGDLVALLLSCCDHIGELVADIAEGSGDVSAEKLAKGEPLLTRLNAYLTDDTEKTDGPSSVAAQREETVHASGGGEVETDNWHISLRFGQDVLRNGMDPLSFIRYLGTIGKIVGITTLCDAMPAAEEMNPETCYLGYEINFQSNADKAAIEGVFEFVRDDCQIHILPPKSRIGAYLGMISSLPEETMRLGEILVGCGTLTQLELDEALRIQRSEDANSGVSVAIGEHHRQIGEILVAEHIVQAPVVEAALEKQNQVKEAKVRESQSVRVDADRLDLLINLVGELVIAGASTSLLAQRAGMPDLLESTATISRLVEEVRDSALMLRMVQIGETFKRFNRVVRDVSRELGKEIELSISGAETELDKTVVDKIGDPLMHLVRNAMDHGIEPAEVRLARGKPAKGTMRLNAYHESGSIVIEVSDDGGGLNRQKILDKALARGIIAPNQNLADHEIYNLIFEPGFSTADQVTNLSGRGVGMDVVRRNIAALRGNIELDSQEHVGTSVKIRLPLTLAIIDGFLMGVGKSSYVVPLDVVRECVQLTEQERQTLRDRQYIDLRGEVLPFVRLRNLFEVSGKPGRREYIVVVQYGGQKAGLVVDELMGEFQAVIKPLGKLFGNLKGIGGSTILGTGEVALILDVPLLIQQAVNAEAQMALAQA
ncbi:chemotaxis protein CheA [Sulfuricella sp.]|uniref:chemotaxis protein CheA n=1 Tax=Sulfuricella sp. TaxID=2099377 RepID=UPI002BBB772C|nr:chemotaxis protein CheA [Sulfuricella sp.]HUX64771.1 chemotaxis protein CheA [Sulfuricella sp.]